MKNYIHKIAKDNIKKNSEFYKYIYVSIFLTFFIVFLTNILSSSMDKTLYEKRAISHGRWDVIISNANIEMRQALDNIDYEKLGYLYYEGEVIYNGSKLGSIGSYDDVGIELANMRLVEGTMPLNHKEIMIEKSMADFLNKKVGESVSLEKSYNHNITTNEYKVVGIVEDYSSGWNGRALSFITHSSSYHEYDLMLKGNEAILFWNELYWVNEEVNNQLTPELKNLYNIAIYNKNTYPDYVETTYKIKGYAAFTNESDFLVQAVEIIVISFISLFSSMMVSLSKRESQFVLLRSMGMTYHQLKKLILYEGYLLTFKALVLSLVSSISLSVFIMFLYSFVNQYIFNWCINFPSLFIQFSVSSFVVYMGLVFPALTVYDLPLTRKNGEILYHSKKRKIRKPTFTFFIRNEIFYNKTWSIFMMFFISIVIIRGIHIVDSTINYQRQRSIAFQNDRPIDFIWHINAWENKAYNYYDFDLSELENDESIHIYQIIISEDKTLKWKNMNNEDELIIKVRDMKGDVRGNLICIDYDQIMKDYLIQKGYKEFLNLQVGEAVVFIPNYNFNEPRVVDNKNQPTLASTTSYPYTNNIKRKNSGLYAKDEGLSVGETIQVSHQSLCIKEIITLDEKLIREYFEEYTVIVNEETLKKCVGDFYGYYFVIDTNKEESRNKVLSFFLSQGIYGNETEFVDCYFEDLKNYYNVESQYVHDLIYNIVLIFVYISLIYMMRLLTTHKMRKTIGLLRNVGMTKRTIYKIHAIYSSIVFLLSVFIIVISWLVISKVSFDTSIISLVHEDHLIVKGLYIFCIYIIYIIFMLLPIKNILDETPLNLMR